jgi:hypothetical protein
MDMRSPVLEASKHLVERNAFAFFSHLGDWLRVSSGSTRLFFIYLSFITITSPLIILLSLGFLMDMARHCRRRRSQVWDL